MMATTVDPYHVTLLECCFEASGLTRCQLNANCDNLSIAMPEKGRAGLWHIRSNENDYIIRCGRCSAIYHADS